MNIQLDASAGGREQCFELQGYTLAGLSWGEPNDTPVIALHGWLDNAASFSRLGPLLAEQGHYLLALDLPGHGHSDHKPPFASYNIWDDLVILHSLFEQLSIGQYHLLGHSRGAMIATLSATAMPAKVLSLQCLDGLMPDTVKVKDTHAQLGKHVSDYLRAPRKRLPGYPSLDDAVAARCKAARMSRAAATPIVERGLYHDGEVFRWRSDMRLTSPSALKFTLDHCRSIVSAIDMPFQLLLAEQGAKRWGFFEEFVSEFAQLNMSTLPGGHHFHLDDSASAIAEAICSLLDASVSDATG